MIFEVFVLEFYLGGGWGGGICKGFCEGLVGVEGFFLVFFNGGVGMVIVLVGFLKGIFGVFLGWMFIGVDVIVGELEWEFCGWVFFMVKGFGWWIGCCL